LVASWACPQNDYPPCTGTSFAELIILLYLSSEVNSQVVLIVGHAPVGFARGQMFEEQLCLPQLVIAYADCYDPTITGAEATVVWRGH
jgi:hypothetical protein